MVLSMEHFSCDQFSLFRGKRSTVDTESQKRIECLRKNGWKDEPMDGWIERCDRQIDRQKDR